MIVQQTFEKDITFSGDDEGHDSEGSSEEENNDRTRKQVKRTKWSIEEQHILSREFKDEIKNSIIPKNEQARQVIGNFACFNKRSVNQIKSKVQHLIKLGNKKTEVF